MQDYVTVFKALSDGTRLRILWLLSKSGTELCVCEIMDSLEVSQYNVSRHLGVLKNAGLVRERKEGKWVFYFLRDPVDRFHARVLRAVEAVPEEQLSEEYRRLKQRLSLRKNGKCVVGGESDRWQRMTEHTAMRE